MGAELNQFTNHVQNKSVVELDALIIGAGVAGLYQLHKLRSAGLNALAVDTAEDVGGTWYWNCYPGAKFDSECYVYQYLFDEKLYKDWSWSERFPGQPEIERWLHYVTDRLGLRPYLRFCTTVTAAEYDEKRGRWIIKTDRGQTYDARFLIGCCGMLSAPLENRFPGQERFRGRIFHTARWPREAIDLNGKRVGVVGVGATGIQVIQTIADKVGQLKVFVRTPQYVVPMKNPKYNPDDVNSYKKRFEELRELLPTTASGFEYVIKHRWADLTPEQRLAVLEETYNDGSLRAWLGGFDEIFTDPQISEEVSEFVREKMRARLKDPKLIEILVPTDYGFGSRRVPLESGYLEVYHRDNVEAICVRNNPIVEVVPEGIRLADGTVHELDIIILATGFDASSGAFIRIDIRGRDGRSLKEEWSRDICSALGLMVHGYPNMFLTGAPLSPSAALCNMTTCLQQQVEWITDCIQYIQAKGHNVIEPTASFQEAWVRHHDDLANSTLFSKTNSWYTGTNVEGKPRRMLSYTGGVGKYRQKCAEVAAGGYEGFAVA